MEFNPLDFEDSSKKIRQKEEVNFEIENTLWYNSKILPALVTI